MTQEQVAERLQLTTEMIRRHEHGLAYPGSNIRHEYVLLYGASELALGLVVDAKPTGPTPTDQYSPQLPVVINTSTRLEADAIASIREYIKQVVALDNQFGGTDLAPLATRFFKSVHRQLGEGLYEPSIRADLIAAAGELAEVTGWLAYDADRQDLVRRMNQESLYFTRMVGDKAIELLTLQNSSMQAGFLGRPAEALDIAESVLTGPYKLSSRLRSLFLIRKARALAQGGDGAAVKLIDEARRLHSDGLASSDPNWTWWIDERELSWHHAMCRSDLGDLRGALDAFEQSVEATPTGETRSQYLHRAYLFQAQTRCMTWDMAEETLRDLAPLALQVSSRRTVNIIRAALIPDAQDIIPTGLRELGTQLLDTIGDSDVW
ncbi:MAG: XRE family transcriptional regulator [Pseudonocardia sp.]